MLALAREALARGSSAILDGTFSLRSWREELYAIARDAEVTNVVAVRCFCDDEEIIKVRLDDRSLHDYMPENEVTQLDSYLQTKTECDREPLLADRLLGGGRPAIVTFDSGKYTVELTAANGFPVALRLSGGHAGRLEMRRWIRRASGYTRRHEESLRARSTEPSVHAQRDLDDR